jgi:hypothetical protein
MFGLRVVDAFEVDRLLGALLLRFDQRRNVGATDSVVDDDGAILLVDEIEGIRGDVKAPGMPSAPLLIYLDLHSSLDVVWHRQQVRTSAACMSTSDMHALGSARHTTP